jgi:hypothetical protein
MVAVTLDYLAGESGPAINRIILFSISAFINSEKGRNYPVAELRGIKPVQPIASPL